MSLPATLAASVPQMPSAGFAPPVPDGYSGHGTPPELGYNWPVLFRDADGIPLNMMSFEQIDFGAISYKEIFQNAKTILATPLFSAALERMLGVDARIVDLPMGAAAEATVALLQALYFWEPRVVVVDIQFTADVLNGHLIATLQLEVRNVIYGTDTQYSKANIFAAPTRVQGALPPVSQPVLIPGPPGPAGARGSLWFTGAGAPPTSTTPAAQANDMYLNTTTGDVYQFRAVTGTRGATSLRWEKVQAPWAGI